VLPALKEALLAGSPRETLERLAALRGFYVPALHGAPPAREPAAPLRTRP